jgi:uroporphyrinogen-III decarboxylase
MRMHEEVQRIIDGRLPCGFISWNRGGLDLAIQLRGYNNFLIDTIERPDFIHALMGRVTDERCRWYDAYAEWSGQPLGPTWLGDDWINVPYISPSIFADFVLPRYLEIEAHHGGIGGIHSCGNQTPVQKYLLQVKSLNTFEVSPWTDLLGTLDNLPPDKHLAIALHPNDVLVASPDQMRRKLEFIRDNCQGRSYAVASAGLTPIRDQYQDYLTRIQTWLDLARETFRA